MLPHGLRVVEVAALDDDDRIPLKLDGLSDDLVLASHVRVAVEPSAHAVEVDDHLRRFVQPVRFRGNAQCSRDPFPALTCREMVIVEKPQQPGFWRIRRGALLGPFLLEDRGDVPVAARNVVEGLDQFERLVPI